MLQRFRVAISLLVGDTTGDGSTASDIGRMKGQSGQVLTTANFRSDVNRDGTINSGDAFIVRARSGQFIP